MEKVFTLEELQQIRGEFPIHDVYFLCVVGTFKKKWRHSSPYIRRLADKFLSESTQWENYCGSRLLFYQKGVAENIFNSERDFKNLKQIRIDFLDWLIENTES